MARPRDPWDGVQELVTALEAKRANLKQDAETIRAEAGALERRYRALRDEYAAVGLEIRDLTQLLAMHRARLGAHPRALPPPEVAYPGRVGANAVGKVYDRSSPDHVVNLIGAWVRAHDDVLVSADLAQDLVARGRYPSVTAAGQAVYAGLVAIGSGYVRESRGVYRFYALDGVALRTIEDAAAAITTEENVA